MRLPQAKLENIVVQDLGNELLVYNLTTHKAYTLNQTSKIVYESCDGATTFDELKRRHNFTDDLIHLTLAELAANDLLANYESHHFGNLSRREVIKRVGLMCAVALPAIAGITATAAASAASGTTVNNACQTNADCGSDAPYCDFLVTAAFSPVSACCAILTATYAKGTPVSGREYASCSDCLAGIAQGCCSGRVTNTTCSGMANNFSCSGTCA